MAPKPITQAARRGKRIISSPVSSEESRESEGEDELESEGEPPVDKGKGKAGPSRRSSAAATDDMDVDDDDDPIEESGEEELDQLDDASDIEEDDDEEYEEEEEQAPPPPKPTPFPSRQMPARAATTITIPAPKTPVAVATGPKSLRIRLNVSRPSPLGQAGASASTTSSAAQVVGGKRPSREAAKKSGKRTKVAAMEAALGSDQDGESEIDELADEDELDELDEDEPPARANRMDIVRGATDPYGSEGESSRAVSPTKLTARQRAKGNADLQGGLMELPAEVSSKKMVLTEAERAARREEMARRRKRQTDQKKQDEQDETINRLLRAQTGRSRSKIEAPDGADDGTAGASGTADNAEGGQGRPRSRNTAVTEGMIRWVSTVLPATGDTGGEKEGRVVCRVGVPKKFMAGPGLLGKSESTRSGKGQGVCAVEGCGEPRKYRCTRNFEVGGCSMEHLKRVNEGLAVA